jgi:endonuclease/exonuclease/phosphatase family metal-dependent hydrolase
MFKLRSLDVLIPMPAPQNYPDAAGPRYAGGTPSLEAAGATLTIVSYNIKFALHPARAVALLRSSPELRDADVLLLQEMDAPATDLMARALGCAYVYYPSTVHPIARKDFGCAILSRLPIEDDRKLLLPHVARLRRIQRAAVGATIAGIRFYSVHLSTMVDNGPRQRRQQLSTIIEDAVRHPRVVIAGDFNSPRVADVATDRGYEWPTRKLGRTNAFWTMDHVLVRGVPLDGDDAFGAVKDTVGASDHKPVWARLSVEG